MQLRLRHYREEEEEGEREEDEEDINLKGENSVYTLYCQPLQQTGLQVDILVYFSHK